MSHPTFYRPPSRPHARSHARQSAASRANTSNKKLSPTSSTPSTPPSYDQSARNPTPLHRRLLFPSLTSDSIPPLLVSPGFSQLDPQLYDLIALICREFVLPWYNRLSPDPDRAFLGEVTRVLRWVIGGIEERVSPTGKSCRSSFGESGGSAHRKDNGKGKEKERVQEPVDLQNLLMVDVPEILQRHVKDFREAKSRAGSSISHNLSFEEMFHSFQPHIGVIPSSSLLDEVPNPRTSSSSADMTRSSSFNPSTYTSVYSHSSTSPSTPPHQKETSKPNSYTASPTYLRSLTTSLLSLLLPPAVLSSPSAQSIIREILVQIIFSSAIFGKIVEPWFLAMQIGNQLEKMRLEREKKEEQRSRKAKEDLRRKEEEDEHRRTTLSYFEKVSRLHQNLRRLEKIPSISLTVFKTLSTILTTITSSIFDASDPHFNNRSVPSGSLTLPSLDLVATLLDHDAPGRRTLGQAKWIAEVAVLLSGGASDRFVSKLLSESVFTPSFLSLILSSASNALFPDGHPPPPVPDPTPEEQVKAWDKAVDEISFLIPDLASKVLIPGSGGGADQGGDLSERKRKVAEEVLDVLGNRSCNVHLVMTLLDTAVVRLFPELGVGTDGRA